MTRDEIRALLEKHEGDTAIVNALHRKMVEGILSELENTRIVEWNPSKNDIVNEKGDGFVLGAQSVIKHYNAMLDNRISELCKELDDRPEVA